MKSRFLCLLIALVSCGPTTGSVSNGDTLAEEESAARVVCSAATAHSVCQPNQACIGYRCQTAAACTTTMDCVWGMQCLQQLCKTPRPCNAGQCAQGYYCDADQFCQEPAPGTGCTADADCDQGYYCSSQNPAQLGVCTAGCLTDDHCDSASVCNAGDCQVAQCGADSDCPGSKICNLNTLQCVPSIPPGSSACTYDTDCDPVCGTRDNAVRCAGFSRSDKVCDIDYAEQLSDQANGTKSGVCRDRCVSGGPLFGVIVPCPNGLSCETQGGPFGIFDPALWCGGETSSGAYSACY